MMKAIKAALEPSYSQDHLRIVVFLTDGYVGNDMEILSEIQKHPNARVFAYGIGSSVNRFLISGMGQAGRGESEIISEQVNANEADAAAKRLYEHLRSPLLTDVSLDFGSLPVADVYPAQIPDLFAGHPIVVTGRYTGAAKGAVHLRANRAGDVYAREVAVNFPVTDSSNSVLPNLWARRKIEHLMEQDWAGIQQQQMKPALQKEITQLGLDYGLMTQFTSFVAVEEKISNIDGRPEKIQVPVELPQGVQVEQGWQSGSRDAAARVAVFAQLQSVPATTQSVIVNGAVGGPTSTQLKAPRMLGPAPPPPPPPTTGAGTGSGGGVGTGLGSGVGGGLPREAVVAEKTRVPTIAVKDEALASKLHPLLFADYDCWQKLADKSVAASCHVVGGKLAVEIVTAGEVSSADLAAAGFGPDSNQPIRNHLRGHVAIDKLAELAALKSVQFIAPAK
jgi:hypothetical protein